MKFYFLTLIFSICTSINAQNILGIKEIKDSAITLYRIAARKCPGSVSHGNCFRQLFIISNSTPMSKSIKKRGGNIYYKFGENDMLFLAGDYQKFWLLGYFYDNKEYSGIYDKIDSHNLYSFTVIEQIILKDQRNFFLGKYELKNMSYYIIYMDVSYLNSKILEGDILIDLPGNVRVHVVIAFGNDD